MISKDNQQFLTVELYRVEQGELRSEIRVGFSRVDNEFKNIHNELKNIRSEVQSVREISLINSAKIDAYRDFTSIWFTVIAVLVAIVGVMATLAPMFRDIYRDARQKRSDKDTIITRAEVQDMINSSVSQLVHDAVSHALESAGK